jgi:hypothetical protein
VVDSENYKIVARLLREQASRAGMAPKQAAKDISLAEYFEKLAANPSFEIADPYFD